MLSRVVCSLRYSRPSLSITGFNSLTKAVGCQRCEHTAASSHVLIDDAKLLSEIPSPPPVMDAEQFAEHTKLLCDTLSHFGLDSRYPPGLVRMGLDSLHAFTGLPWWEVIVLGVVAGRVCLLPFTVMNMRNTARQVQHQPELTRMTKKMNEARKAGDYMAMQLAQFQMLHYQRKHGLASTKSLFTALPQAFYFMSYFIGIKRMASAPLESFKTEGALWFVDLTATDPTWLLSIVCASTLALALRTGVDFTMPGQYQHLTKLFFIGVPIFILFTTHFFPTAVILYWTASNSVSLLIALLFRSPQIRSMLKLPPLVKKVKPAPNPYEQAEEKKSNVFTNTYRLVRTKIKDITAKRVPTESQMKRNDERAFRKAGQGPIIATYTYNPKERYPEAFKKRSFWSMFWHKD